jgi:hypothetical protein
MHFLDFGMSGVIRKRVRYAGTNEDSPGNDPFQGSKKFGRLLPFADVSPGSGPKRTLNRQMVGTLCYHDQASFRLELSEFAYQFHSVAIWQHDIKKD